jgi:hypothetical protein
MSSQQLQGQLQKELSVNTISTAQILIIKLQRKRSIKTTATRPVPDIAQWRTTILPYTTKKSIRIKGSRNNTNKQ